jgi:hypothetical protein
VEHEPHRLRPFQQERRAPARLGDVVQQQGRARLDVTVETVEGVGERSGLVALDVDEDLRASARSALLVSEA